jgi:hypothetical protein
MAKTPPPIFSAALKVAGMTYAEQTSISFVITKSEQTANKEDHAERNRMPRRFVDWPQRHRR